MPDGSRFFGSPTKLFEYMAMGKGIVASRLEQLAEVLEHDRTAWLVTPGDPHELAEGIMRLALDPQKRASLGAAARRAAVERHSWTHNVACALDDIPLQSRNLDRTRPVPKSTSGSAAEGRPVISLRALVSALRREPLHDLMGEAAWRGVRGMRKQLFAKKEPAAATSTFIPSATTQGSRILLPLADREAILAYADAVLRGEYPLMGYGRPNLGVTPDWHCDWVSGKTWPLYPCEKIQVVRHDGSDVKAPWELSRLQFAPVVAKAWADR